MSITFTADQARHIMSATEGVLQKPELAAALGGANGVKCLACKIALNAAAAGAISVALTAIMEVGPEAAAVTTSVAAIAQAAGLPAAVISGILTSVASGFNATGPQAVEAVIKKLCEAMKACK